MGFDWAEKMELKLAGCSPLLLCFAVNLIPVTAPSYSHDNTFYETPLKWPAKDGVTGFGGVVNKWMTDVLSNHTDTREIIKFAVKYARSHSPAMFPPAASQYTMHVRNVSRLKLIYSLDGKNPAMFGAVDPMLQQAVYIPLVWGLLYTFYIHLVMLDVPSVIIHRFTILEYSGTEFYVLEHTFHRGKTGKQGSHLQSGVDASEVSVSGRVEACLQVDKSKTDKYNLGQCKIQMDSRELSTSWDKLDQYKLVMTTRVKCVSGESCVQTNQYQNNRWPELQPCFSGDRCQVHSSHSDILPQNFCHSKDGINTADWNFPRRCAKQNVTILSYNIWNTNSVSGRDGAYINRIKSLGKLCADSHADIITFQEVRFQDGRGGYLGPNQLDHLSRILPDYQFVYQPAQVQSDQLPGLAVEGIAIFSKYPIIHRNAILLSRNPDDVADGHQRVLMHAEIDIPTVGPIHVLSSHLSLSHEARLLSVVEISDYLTTLQGPVFLTGDMNAEPHNEEVRFLAGKQSLYGRKLMGFHDIWEYHHGSSNHGNSTENNKQNPEGLTFSTLESKLTKRIDLIFFKQHPCVAVLNVTLLDNGHRGKKAASDHLGIMATFAITEDGKL